MKNTGRGRMTIAGKIKSGPMYAQGIFAWVKGE
jgi:hypothetical protein